MIVSVLLPCILYLYNYWSKNIFIILFPIKNKQYCSTLVTANFRYYIIYLNYIFKWNKNYYICQFSVVQCITYICTRIWYTYNNTIWTMTFRFFFFFEKVLNIFISRIPLLPCHRHCQISIVDVERLKIFKRDYVINIGGFYCVFFLKLSITL